MKIGHWPSGFRCWVSGVSSEKARASRKPDTRHLKPMLREGFTTPDNVQKKDLFFYHVTRSEFIIRGNKGTLKATKNIGKNSWLTVVYKEISERDGFIITAYFLNKRSKGDVVWPRR